MTAVGFIVPDPQKSSIGLIDISGGFFTSIIFSSEKLPQLVKIF